MIHSHQCRGTSARDMLTRDEFIQLLIALMADSDMREDDAPLTSALRRFLAKHGVYSASYLLLHLSKISWLWELSGQTGPDPELVYVEIDIAGDDVMDMHLTLTVPEGREAYIPALFEDRLTRRERMVYLVVRPLVLRKPALFSAAPPGPRQGG